MKISRLSLSLIKIHSPVQDFLPFNPSAFSFFLPSFLRQGKHFHVCARAVMLSKSNLSRSIYRTISAAPISITALSAIYAPANVSARKDRSRDSFPPPLFARKGPPPLVVPSSVRERICYRLIIRVTEARAKGVNQLSVLSAFPRKRGTGEGRGPVTQARMETIKWR